VFSRRKRDTITRLRRARIKITRKLCQMPVTRIQVGLKFVDRGTVWFTGCNLDTSGGGLQLCAGEWV
jgi:hypothetical protein